MRFLSLAARNLRRNARRTLLSLAAIAVGLAIMLLMVAVQTGTYQQILRQAIGDQAGHVVVQHRAYTEDADATAWISGSSTVVERLAQQVPGALLTPRVQVHGLLAAPRNTAGVLLRGVLPDAEAAAGSLDERVVEGRWLADGENGVLLGVHLARRLDVQVGDRVVFTGQRPGGDVESVLLRVRGLFRTGAGAVDGSVAVTTLTPVRQVLGDPDALHQIALHLPRADTAEEVAARVGPSLPPALHALTWKEALPDLVAFIRLDRLSGDWMNAVLGVIVAMGVLNALLMGVLERTREFGVMLAVGMRPRQLAGLVLLEAVLLGCTGALLGGMLGAALTAYTVRYGIDYAPLVGGETVEMEGLALSTHLYGAWNPSRSLQYLVGAVCLTVLAALYPAYHLYRLTPVSALHHR